MFISKKKKNSSIKKLPIIKSILSDEMNNECFDCGALNPEFISINNAIFLCKNCSYLHKKFPVEISKIILNNLYKLEEKELYYLYFGGNRKLSEFIYFNPRLSKYKSDMLYKMKELIYYRNNLSNIVNEKLGINKNKESHNYIKTNDNNTNNFNTLNLNNEYKRRKILYINEREDFQNIFNDSQLIRLSTTNKISKQYKKRYIPGNEIDYQNQNNNRISVHNRNPAILLDLDYNKDMRNKTNKGKSNLVWFNNLNNENEHKNSSYGNVDRNNFNYKNYINNTININNSNNNNFYFNQSETDIDKKYNIRNSANNSYVSFYNKNQFRIPKDIKYPSPKNSSLNLSSYKVYFKPKLPKCSINLAKIKNKLNFSNFDNYYTIQNFNNNSTFKNNTTNNSNNKNDINNTKDIKKKYNQTKSQITKKNKIKIKLNLNDFNNNFSDESSKLKIKNKLSQINNINQNENNLSYNSNNNSLEESEKIQNLSVIEIDKQIDNNPNEIKQEKKECKKYNKKYQERKNLESNERKKMEFEENRRKQELKKMVEEQNKKKKLNKKKITKKERLKLIEEERLAMQQEELNAKKKKAFDDKIIKEEDEEYELEIETPREINKNKEKSEIEDIKEKKEDIKVKKDNDVNNNNNNSNKKNDIVDTFKNSIRNRYKRKKNKL